MRIRIVQKLNTGLFIVAVLMAVYIIALPFVNEAQYWVYRLFSSQTYTFTPGGEQVQDAGTFTGEDISDTPQQNTLLVEGIGIHGEIFEGKSVSVLEKGIWHRPNSSTPDRGSNTVLVAHRYLYRTESNSFYNLNKVKVGNKIIVWWERRKYTYTVTEIKTVPPEAVEIEGPTKDPILTLYTCTLITASDRLMVRAKLESIQ
jgi:LPXTG-site transpeptidase (sortase) family protein